MLPFPHVQWLPAVVSARVIFCFSFNLALELEIVTTLSAPLTSHLTPVMSDEQHSSGSVRFYQLIFIS